MDFGTTPFLLKYRGMIVKLARQYAPPSSVEFSDLCQAGVLGLYRAKKTYRKGKGSVFGTWAWWRIRKEIQTAHHSIHIGIASDRTCKEKGITVVGIGDNTPDAATDTTAFDIVRDREDAIERGRLQAHMLVSLNCYFTPEERRIIIDHYIHGMTIALLNKKYGSKSWSVVNKAKKLLMSPSSGKTQLLG